MIVYVVMHDNGLEYDDHCLDFVRVRATREEADADLADFNKRPVPAWSEHWERMAFMYYYVFDIGTQKIIETVYSRDIRGETP